MGENQGIVRLYQLYGKYVFSSLLENSKAKLNAKVDIPFTQKAAVKVLILLLKTKLLRPFGWLISKKK